MDKSLEELLERSLVLDRVWVVCMPRNQGIIYHPPGTSPGEAWQNCTTFLNDNHQSVKFWSKDWMRKDGYRARQVSIVLMGK